jgi:hypothetical protein
MLASTAVAQTPLGTSFTYQGRLEESGSPANGTYDFRFMLFDAPLGGNQVGPIVTRDDVFVSTGLFTVGIDFGAVFVNQRRFLEIGVRPGASTGTYDVLSGRQELTAAPSALFGASAPWTGVTGKPAGFADNVDNDMLAALVCSNGQVPKSNGSTWACGTDLNPTYTAGPGIQVTGTVISIPSLAVTNAMMATDAVTQAKVADNAIGTAELQNNAVTGAKIAPNAVLNSHINTGAVGADEIAANGVTRGKIDGAEVPIYTVPEACAYGGGTLTTAPLCSTLRCDTTPVLYYTCAGACTQPVPILCPNELAGYLVSASSNP